MPKKSRKNVGLIGLGIIGSRVADSLRIGGFRVFVWNRTPRAAPNFLPSPRQVAELCDVIQIFVADAHALFDVLETMGDAITPSHIIICNATIGPEATLDAARIVQERGAQFLDAPFTGSKLGAQNRELVYFIGGDDTTLKAVEPILQASSKAIVKIGKIGDAAVIKVATNMITAVTVQALAEAYAVVKDSAIDPRLLVEALKHHAVRSGLSDAKLAQILNRDYEPNFSLKHMFKDVQLGIHIANSLDIDLPATTATAGLMYGGLTRGWADEDFAVLARSYQKEFQAPPLPVPPHANAGETGSSSAPATPAAPPPPPRESTPAELRDAGIKLPDPPIEPPSQNNPVSTPPAEIVPAPGADASPTKADADTEKKPSENTPESPVGDGAPGEPARQHTPFVRLRRWFGTGSAT